MLGHIDRRADCVSHLAGPLGRVWLAHTFLGTLLAGPDVKWPMVTGRVGYRLLTAMGVAEESSDEDSTQF